MLTKKQWLADNNSFFHVTQTSNIPSILENGLLRRNVIGICVIRDDHELLVEYLCQMMLITTDETTFSVIAIQPKKHNLLPEEIINDNVVEFTNPLHNYILRDKLIIEKSDIIRTHETIPNGIADVKLFEEKLAKLGLVNPLL